MGVVVGFGQYYVGQWQCFGKYFGGVGCVLVGYCVDYEQCFDWCDCGVQCFDFVYYCLVDVEVISGIDQQYIDDFVLCGCDCCFGDVDWILVGFGGEEVYFDLFGQCVQLFDCCWMIDVVVDYYYVFFFVFGQEVCQFVYCGGFVCVLQVCYQYYGWWCLGEIEFGVDCVYYCGQFVVDYFYQCLVW